MTARVQELFLRALELEPTERQAFVDAASRVSNAERDEVLALLDHDDRAADSDFLGAPVDCLGPALTVGQQVGGYTVGELLGVGGMGEVYLVEQHQPLHRRLALKLIRFGMDSQQVLRRFDAERQALARMNHPGIAQVFDAATTAAGQPYFVMELVEGIPITDYCETNGLVLEERLELFVDVCNAVQHAHLRGVIHRDLKPSNILVARGEQGPVAKIIDFGLARATDRTDSADDSTTEHGQLIGTPDYMSPEQVDGDPDIDTRSDVYALGVLLYVLLTRVCPLDDVRGAGDEVMRRRIREEIPRVPSRRSGDTRLRGDLDAIAMTAIAKDRAERYQSVGELCADLLRHRRGLPVSARAPGLGYRARKFVARHRGRVLSVVTVLLVTVAGLVGTNIGFAEADAVRDEAKETIDSFALLAIGIELQRATFEERMLYPAWPEQAPRLRQWLTEHGRPLLDKIHLTGNALREVRKRALPYDAQMQAKDRLRAASMQDELLELRRRRAWLEPIALPGQIGPLRERIRDLEQMVEVRGVYSFAKRMDHVMHDALAALEGNLDEFLGGKGAVRRVEERLRWAETIRQRSIDSKRVAWNRARIAVAADPRFEGFQLTPQLGLVPIDRDPLSGLQEFAHLRSGDVPERDPVTCELQIDAGSALVFVLVPGVALDRGGRLAPFFCAKHEMTQAQWMRLGRGDNPSVRRSVPAQGLRQPVDLPVENVSWTAANTLLRQHALQLPTEVQWLHARGPVVESSGEGALARVTALAAGHFGIAGMTTNVREWCRDGHEATDLPPRPGDGLRELADRTFRVIRGRGREFADPRSRDARTGVRPVRSVRKP